MTDNQQFLLVLTLIYLVECLHWMPRHAAGFLSVNLRLWRMRQPLPLFGNHPGGLLFSFPLPPLGVTALTQPWPVAITPDGVSAPGLEQPNPGGVVPRPIWFLAWDDIYSITYEKRRLVLNGEHGAWCCSAAQASYLTGIIRNLQTTPAPERLSRIRKCVRRAADHRRARSRILLFRRETLLLRISANILFLMTFAGLPLAYLLHGPIPQFFLMIASLWILMLWIALESRRLHRYWYPELKEERRYQTISCLILPVEAIRAADQLGRGLGAEFHPLAFAHALGLGERCSALVRDLRFPVDEAGLCRSHPRAAANTRLFRHEILLPALKSLLEPCSSGPPPEADHYCPRCYSGYLQDTGTCADCTGVRLVRWSEASSTLTPLVSTGESTAPSAPQ